MAFVERGWLSLAVIAAAVALTVGETAGAQRVLSEGIKDLASQISSSVTQQQKRKIAVPPFRELDGRATVLGTYMSEALVTQLVNSGNLEVVERTMLDRILSEMRLGESGLIDPNTAKRVGQVAGVDAIVTGTITDLQSYVAVNCRLIDAATGRIFAATEARILKDDDVKKIMGVAMGRAAAPDGAGSAEPELRSAVEPAPPPSEPAAPVEWTGRELNARAVSVTPLANETRVAIILLNLSRYKFSVPFFTADYEPSHLRTYLVDDLGSRYPAVGGSVFLRPYDKAGDIELVPGVPVRVDLKFRGISPSASAVTLVLDLPYWQRPLGYTVSLGPIRVVGQKR